MSSAVLEIERKYRLAAAPDPRVLAAYGAEVLRIEQVYLAAPPPGRRVRQIERADGSVERWLSRKTPVHGLVREELQHEIDEAEFEALLAEVDPDRRPIRKTRFVVPHGEQRVEIDVFAEPAGLVLVEVELRHEDEPVILPGWLGEHLDVSEDPRFANTSLARRGAELPPY